MGFYFKARRLFGYSTNIPRFKAKTQTAVTWKENITEAEALELGLQHSRHFCRLC